MRTRVVLVGFLFLFVVGSVHAQNINGDVLRSVTELQEACHEEVQEQLIEERNVYRSLQMELFEEANVRTSDLVPYATQNFWALRCRLRSLCDAVGTSQGHLQADSIQTIRPLGCQWLSGARGRSGGEDRVFKSEPIAECTKLSEEGDAFAFTPNLFDVENTCDQIVDDVLIEEEEVLKLLTAQDSTRRATDKIVHVMQFLLSDLRRGLLDPLRGFVDLSGSILQPIPCLLTQCH